MEQKGSGDQAAIFDYADGAGSYKGKNRSNESIGIGLYLTKMIITKQNGVITAKNRESKGAEFNIKFYNET